MKSEMANRLKEILDGMSQEQFDQEWSQITALKLDGPTFVDAIEYFSVSIDKMGKFEMNTDIQNDILPTTNYLAA